MYKGKSFQRWDENVHWRTQSLQSGNLLFLSGHLPATVEGDLITGKVGKDLTPEEGQKAAERVGLSILATLNNELGDLDKVKRIVKLVGFVNCVDGFEQQPFVINGCSDLMARYSRQHLFFLDFFLLFFSNTHDQ